MIVRVGKRLHVTDVLRRAVTLLGKRQIQADRIAGHLVLEPGNGLVEAMRFLAANRSIQRGDSAQEPGPGRSLRQVDQFQSRRYAGEVRRLVSRLELGTHERQWL